MKVLYDLKTQGSNFLLKLGSVLIFIGLLILLLKELIILILASIFIGVGVFLIVFSLRFRQK